MNTNLFKTAYALSLQLNDKSVANFVHYLFKTRKKELSLDLILKAYTPITNSVKLDNGAKPHQGLRAVAGKTNYFLKNLDSKFQTKDISNFNEVFKKYVELDKDFETRVWDAHLLVIKQYS